jgi:hypothetical protein
MFSINTRMHPGTVARVDKGTRIKREFIFIFLFLYIDLQIDSRKVKAVLIWLIWSEESVTSCQKSGRLIFWQPSFQFPLK